MKIIHCADLHIDSKMESNLSREQAKERKEELLRCYEKMISFAKDNDIHIVMIVGDLFDKSNVGKKAKLRVMEQIILNPDIDFLYLRGNHDNVDILDGIDEAPSNLKFFNNKEFTKYTYGDVVIAGIELDKNNNGSIYNQLVLDKAKTNIIMLHGQETQYNNDKTEVINLRMLKDKFIDYLALGHIHQYKQERLDDRGVYCYSGCLEGRGFDECGVKGFVVLDINCDKDSDGSDANSSKITTTFVETSHRVFHEIPIDVTGMEGLLLTNNIIEKIKVKLADIPHKDLVKIVLKGEMNVDDDIDMERIKAEFVDKLYFIKIYNHTKIRIDYNSFTNDRSLKGEFVRLMSKQDIDEDEKLKIIEIGLKSLRGEDIEL